MAWTSEKNGKGKTVTKNVKSKGTRKTTTRKTTRKIQQSAQRKIDREKINNKREHIIQIEAQIEKGNLEEATGAIEDLKSATMQTNSKKQFSKFT